MAEDAGDATENTSGRMGDVPMGAGTGRFHFGATIFGWIWLLAHGLPVLAAFDLVLALLAGSLGVIIVAAIHRALGLGTGPAVSPYSAEGVRMALVATPLSALRVAAIAWRVYLGMRGGRFAWHHRRFASVAEFRAVGEEWRWWAARVFIALYAIGWAERVGATFRR